MPRPLCGRVRQVFLGAQNLFGITAAGAEGAISSPGTSQALSTVQGWQLWKAARQAAASDELTQGASRPFPLFMWAETGESLRSITERGRNPRHIYAWKVPL